MPGVVIMVVRSIQWVLRRVEQSGEMGAVIHEWQFVNQAERRQKDRLSGKSLRWGMTSSVLPFQLCSEEHGAGGRVLPQSARDEALWPEPVPPGLHWTSAGRPEAAHGCRQAAQGHLRAPGDRAHLREGASSPRPMCVLSSLGRMHAGCLYTDVGWWQGQITVMKGVLSLLWNLALILNVAVSFCILGRHAYSYSNSLMEIADWLTPKGVDGEY